MEFTTNGKALDATETRSGDLILTGYGAVWEGLDADAENFLPQSFRSALPGFLRAGAPVCFHHKRDQVIGKVLDATEDAHGVKVRARIDHQPDGSALRHLYDLIKRGTMRNLSFGGIFRRAETATGRMIDRVERLTELSVTGVPSHALTGFEVAEVKALVDPAGINAISDQLAAMRLKQTVDGIAFQSAVAEFDAMRVRHGLI